eukprot:5107843-Amphidinium_carterae.2
MYSVVGDCQVDGDGPGNVNARSDTWIWSRWIESCSTTSSDESKGTSSWQTRVCGCAEVDYLGLSSLLIS